MQRYNREMTRDFYNILHIEQRGLSHEEALELYAQLRSAEQRFDATRLPSVEDWEEGVQANAEVCRKGGIQDFAGILQAVELSCWATHFHCMKAALIYGDLRLAEEAWQQCCDDSDVSWESLAHYAFALAVQAELDD